MRKRKEERRAVECSETLIPIEGKEKKRKEANGFFACYLLTSLSPRYKGHTYIGFTVNPRRRIRQHNGEIRSGAWRTKKRRPWEMVLCISGFPTNVSALQFEWAWQHPAESLAVRQAAATFKSFSGVANKIKLAYTMLNLPNWQSLKITVNYFSTKYSIHSASCPSLPDQMKVHVCTMEELPSYARSHESLSSNEDERGDDIYNEPSNNSGSLEETSTDTLKNISADFLDSDDEAFYGQCRPFKQYGREQPRDLSSLEVDCRPFDEIDLLTRTSSIVTSISTAATDRDTDVLGFIRESRDKKVWQGSKQVATEATVGENQQTRTRHKRFTTAEIANKDQQATQSSTVLQNVEVIDLLTPSPNCTVRSCQKKRRLPSVSPVIIDLT